MDLERKFRGEPYVYIKKNNKQNFKLSCETLNLI